MLTQRHVDKKAQHLAEQQQKFVNTLFMMFDVVERLEKFIAALNVRLEAHEAVMQAQSDELKTALDGFEKLIGMFGETNLSVKENSDKLDKFILKMESYFGSGAGLEYDN